MLLAVEPPLGWSGPEVPSAIVRSPTRAADGRRIAARREEGCRRAAALIDPRAAYSRPLVGQQSSGQTGFVGPIGPVDTDSRSKLP